MALDPALADLLTRWARWCLAGNRAGLGYAQSGYAERVGSSWSTDTAPVPVDPDVMRVDHCVRLLPIEHRKVIVAHYLKTGRVYIKRHDLGLTRDRYYELLDHGRAFVGQLLRENISCQLSRHNVA